MRLLRTTERDQGGFEMKEFFDHNTPRYAILSHTWGDEEVSYRDMQGDSAAQMKGYEKIKRFCSKAKARGFQWAWVDTCCIDKTSSAELSEAINSMYRWYQEAEECHAYLADVPAKAFESSRWFTRGWTLQELIAPPKVTFFDGNWGEIGTRESLNHEISNSTGIPVGILSGTEGLDSISVAQRMSWAARRETSRLEDRAYSLLGIFGIYMPLIYGEGTMAFVRLQEEIIRVTEDYSIFAWKSTKENYGGLLASSPDAFADSAHIVSAHNPMFATKTAWSVSNRGINIELPFMGLWHQGLGLAILNCARSGNPKQLFAIYLRDYSLQRTQFERFWCGSLEIVDRKHMGPSQFPIRRLCIHQRRSVSRGTVSKYKYELEETIPSLVDQHTELKSGVEFFEKMFTIESKPDQSSAQESDGIRTPPLVTELGHASESGNIDKIRYLLRQPKVLVNLSDQRGLAPLFLAAAGGHAKCVWLLLCNPNVNVNLKNGQNQSTALYITAQKGYNDIVWLLLSRGDIKANEGSADWPSRPVKRAAREGHVEIVEMFLSREDIDDNNDGESYTILSRAAMSGQESMVEMLLAKTDIAFDTKNLDSSAWKPQHYAAANGNAEIVKLLLEYGIDIDEDNPYTLIQTAAMCGQKAIVEMLFDHGADINAKGFMKGRTALHSIFKFQGEGNVLKAIVEFLIAHGADIDAKDHDGHTPLQLALKEILLRGKWQDKGPLLEAILESVKVLLAHGASIDTKDNAGKTALHLAAEGGFVPFFALIPANPSGIDVEDNDGKPPLFYAVLRQQETTVKALLDLGAERTWRDRDGQSLHHIAMTLDYNVRGNGYRKIAVLLGSRSKARVVIHQHPPRLS